MSTPRRSRRLRELADSTDESDIDSDNSNDSDPEDFVPTFAGLTTYQLRHGQGRADFSNDIKTAIFKDAITNGYVGKHLPTPNQLVRLCVAVGVPSNQGCRVTKACVQKLVSWITNHVSQATTCGLIMQSCTGKIGRKEQWDVHVAEVLLNAVRDPSFCFARSIQSGDLLRKHMLSGQKYSKVQVPNMTETGATALVKRAVGLLVSNITKARPVKPGNSRAVARSQYRPATQQPVTQPVTPQHINRHDISSLYTQPATPRHSYAPSYLQNNSSWMCPPYTDVHQLAFSANGNTSLYPVTPQHGPGFSPGAQTGANLSYSGRTSAQTTGVHHSEGPLSHPAVGSQQGVTSSEAATTHQAVTPQQGYWSAPGPQSSYWASSSTTLPSYSAPFSTPSHVTASPTPNGIAREREEVGGGGEGEELRLSLGLMNLGVGQDEIEHIIRKRKTSNPGPPQPRPYEHKSGQAYSTMSAQPQNGNAISQDAAYAQGRFDPFAEQPSAILVSNHSMAAPITAGNVERNQCMRPPGNAPPSSFNHPMLQVAPVKEEAGASEVSGIIPPACQNQNISYPSNSYDTNLAAGHWRTHETALPPYPSSSHQAQQLPPIEVENKGAQVPESGPPTWPPQQTAYGAARHNINAALPSEVQHQGQCAAFASQTTTLAPEYEFQAVGSSTASTHAATQAALNALSTSTVPFHAPTFAPQTAPSGSSLDERLRALREFQPGSSRSEGAVLHQLPMAEGPAANREQASSSAPVHAASPASPQKQTTAPTAAPVSQHATYSTQLAGLGSTLHNRCPTPTTLVSHNQALLTPVSHDIAAPTSRQQTAAPPGHPHYTTATPTRVYSPQHAASGSTGSAFHDYTPAAAAQNTYEQTASLASGNAGRPLQAASFQPHSQSLGPLPNYGPFQPQPYTPASQPQHTPHDLRSPIVAEAAPAHNSSIGIEERWAFHARSHAAPH